MTEPTHWIGPYKTLAGSWETWTLNIDGEVNVDFQVIRKPKGEGRSADLFVWIVRIDGEHLDEGPAEALPEAQEAAKGALVDYADRLSRAARSVTFIITPAEPE